MNLSLRGLLVCLSIGALGVNGKEPTEYQLGLQVGLDHCNPNQPCGLCQGDCDEDEDCEDDLFCFHKNSTFSGIIPIIPECFGHDSSRTDYCVALEISTSELSTPKLSASELVKPWATTLLIVGGILGCCAIYGVFCVVFMGLVSFAIHYCLFFRSIPLCYSTHQIAEQMADKKYKKYSHVPDKSEELMLLSTESNIEVFEKCQREKGCGRDTTFIISVLIDCGLNIFVSGCIMSWYQTTIEVLLAIFSFTLILNTWSLWAGFLAVMVKDKFEERVKNSDGGDNGNDNNDGNGGDNGGDNGDHSQVPVLDHPPVPVLDHSPNSDGSDNGDGGDNNNDNGDDNDCSDNDGGDNDGGDNVDGGDNGDDDDDDHDHDDNNDDNNDSDGDNVDGGDNGGDNGDDDDHDHDHDDNNDDNNDSDGDIEDSDERQPLVLDSERDQIVDEEDPEKQNSLPEIDERNDIVTVTAANVYGDITKPISHAILICIVQTILLVLYALYIILALWPIFSEGESFFSTNWGLWEIFPGDPGEEQERPVLKNTWESHMYFYLAVLIQCAYSFSIDNGGADISLKKTKYWMKVFRMANNHETVHCRDPDNPSENKVSWRYLLLRSFMSHGVNEFAKRLLRLLLPLYLSQSKHPLEFVASVTFLFWMTNLDNINEKKIELVMPLAPKELDFLEERIPKFSQELSQENFDYVARMFHEAYIRNRELSDMFEEDDTPGIMKNPNNMDYLDAFDQRQLMRCINDWQRWE